VREEEAGRMEEIVLRRRSGRGRAFDLDVGKALVYCHGQPPHLPRPDMGLTSYSLSVKLLFQERLRRLDDRRSSPGSIVKSHKIDSATSTIRQNAELE
jgi:hypothetical protein